VIVGGGQVSQASEQLQRRVRELGMSVQLREADACAALPEVADVVQQRSPSIVVLSPVLACGPTFWEEARDAVDGARLVALVQPGVTDPAARDAIAAAGVEIVDATPLLGAGTAGEAAPTHQPCQWWEDCASDGTVEVRDGDGALTAAGAERLARTLAGALP
jgi:hypothetical protein